MKKAYIKPEIMFESFTLSASIASCEYKNGLQAQGHCGYPNRTGKIIFTDSVSGCHYVVADNNDTLCYYVPNINNNIFNS